MEASMKQLGLSNTELSTLCLELSVLNHAGVSVGDSVSLLAQEEPDAALRGVLEQTALRADECGSLGKALREADCFPAYLCDLVTVGEESGRPDEALRALSGYYDNRARMDRQLRSALLYPAVLLLIMLAVIVVLLTQVLPVFNDVYANLGGQLTGVAGGLLSLGQALDGLMPVLCALLVLIVVLLGAFAGSFRFRSGVLSFWRKRWGDKGISRKMNTARFAQALAMGISSGLPVEEALDLASSLLSDLPSAQKRCQECKARLDDNVPLAQAMNASGLLPQADCRLLAVGTANGASETVMTQIADRLSEEGDAALEARMGQIEPTLVVASSILVGLILLSVMLPLMHIMTAIG